MAEGISFEDARRLAQQSIHDWVEVYFNEASEVVSFALDSPLRDGARVDVFSSGTVGIILEYAKRSCTQIFRTSVDMLMLERLFDNPRLHHLPDAYREHDRPFERVLEEVVDVPLSDGVREEDTELIEHIEGIDDEIERLRAQRQILIRHAAAARKVREENELRRRQAEQQLLLTYFDELPEIDEKDGMRREWIAGKEVMVVRRPEAVNRTKLLEREFTRRGRALASLMVSSEHAFIRGLDLREVQCLACSADDEGCIYTTRGGRSFWSTRSLPPALDSALRSRVGARSRPLALSLGTGGRFFVRFANGGLMWDGFSPKLDAAIDAGKVTTVAFGIQQESFIVLYEDGAAWGDIPKGLEDTINSEHTRDTTMVYVSLGPHGQYFARFGDGSFVAGGLNHDEERVLYGCGRDIRQVVFGAGGMIIRYNHDREFVQHMANSK